MTTLGWSPLQLISEPAAQQCWYTTVSGCSPYCWGRPPAATRPALTAKSWYGCFVSGSFRTSLSKNLNVFQDIPLDGLDPPVQSPNPIHIFHFHIILAFRNGMPAIQTAYNDIHNMIGSYFFAAASSSLAYCLRSSSLFAFNRSSRLFLASLTLCRRASAWSLHTKERHASPPVQYCVNHFTTHHKLNVCMLISTCPPITTRTHAHVRACAHTRTHTTPLLHMPLTPAV